MLSSTGSQNSCPSARSDAYFTTLTWTRGDSRVLGPWSKPIGLLHPAGGIPGGPSYLATVFDDERHRSRRASPPALAPPFCPRRWSPRTMCTCFVLIARAPRLDRTQGRRLPCPLRRLRRPRPRWPRRHRSRRRCRRWYRRHRRHRHHRSRHRSRCRRPGSQPPPSPPQLPQLPPTPPSALLLSSPPTPPSWALSPPTLPPPRRPCRHRRRVCRRRPRHRPSQGLRLSRACRAQARPERPPSMWACTWGAGGQTAGRMRTA